MDRVGTFSRKQIIIDLERPVADAAGFLAHVSEHLRDDNQSVRPLLSHLVFWHREYVRIANALARQRAPRLKMIPFRHLNAQATKMFAHQTLPALARQWVQLNHRLISNLSRISDWRLDFPLKANIQFCSIRLRIPQMTALIRSHVRRLERTERKYANA